MRLFPIRGGVHPDYHKGATSERPIVVLPLPARLYIPLQQHIGAPAEPLVAEGDRVLKGQLIARSYGSISAPHHAPTSGRIVAVTDTLAPHPSGLGQATIILEPDGLEEWTPLSPPIDAPFEGDGTAISERVAELGIVGMGGAAFPSAVKLNLGKARRLEILLLNGSECEPYLTCDDRVMREHPDEVVDGARLMAHALGTPQVVIAIEGNKPQAMEAMRAAAAPFDSVGVVTLPVRYPLGSERHLVLAVTGRETPAGKLTAEVGVVVHNIATARAVHHAVRFGRPLTHRVVTVSGGAVREPGNIEAPIGTLVSDLVDFCGGFTAPPRHLVNGGPMMGQPLPGLAVPIVKGTSGILALTEGEVREEATGPCIRCGSCITVCPCGLVPVEMAAFIRKEHFDSAARLGVMDCVSCGSCSWVCPAHIPLVHYFNYAKGRLKAQEADRRKNERIKSLADAHTARLERAAEAKRAALAAKKAKAVAPAAEAETNP